MKTVQMYLKEADREKILDALAYDRICDSLFLLEHDDRSIKEIQDAYKNHMNGFIDYLLSLEAVPSQGMVLYLCDADGFNTRFNHEYKMLCLCDIEEIKKDIGCPDYGFSFSDINETLGYLVAENKLTQDYMTELLTQFIEEISFFGTDPDSRDENIEEVYERLDRSIQQIKEGNTMPANDVIKELAEEHGFPMDEKDEYQDKLHSAVMEAEIRLDKYNHWRERSRILEGFGIAAPPFEE